MTMRRLGFWRFAAAGAAVLLSAQPAPGWHGRGHIRATRLAAGALPPEMPRFFVAGAETIAHCSVDPDLFTRPVAAASLHASEAPEHYFDVEVLGGEAIPAHRYDLLMWCGKKGIHPSKIGLAPYAVTEWTQRLTVALAEHRHWPRDEHVRRKCLVYAGILAHYAQDLCMPLHTTIHYDGRATDDGSSPRTGIHQKVDALLEKLPPDAKVAVDPKAVTPFEELFPAVLAELKASHALVDRVYALEDRLPALRQPLAPRGPVADFAKERLAAAARFTARLYLTAWHDAATTTFPPWHWRPLDKPAPTTRPSAPAPKRKAASAAQPSSAGNADPASRRPAAGGDRNGPVAEAPAGSPAAHPQKPYVRRRAENADPADAAPMPRSAP
jgi:hypothetical protein